MCVTWLIHMYDITHTHVWYYSYTCMTWLMHMYDITHSYVWHDSFICMTWLIHMYDMTHSYVWHEPHSHVWHDWFICVTWLIPICGVKEFHVWHLMFLFWTFWTFSHQCAKHDRLEVRDLFMCAWHDTYICEAGFIYMCVMTRFYVWHYSFMRVAWLFHMLAYVWHDSFVCVVWLIHVWGMTYSHDSFKCMTWLPPKDGVIALWPNTRVVKCKYCVSQKRNEANDENQ